MARHSIQTIGYTRRKQRGMKKAAFAEQREGLSKSHPPLTGINGTTTKRGIIYHIQYTPSPLKGIVVNNAKDTVVAKAYIPPALRGTVVFQVNRSGVILISRRRKST